MQELIKKILKAVHLNESTLSTLLGALVVVIVGVLILNYVQQTRKGEEISEEAAVDVAQKIGDVAVETTKEGKIVPKQLADEYQVKAGDSLWSIAVANYGSGYNWQDIAEANQIANPDYLEADQKLKLPKVEIKIPAGEELVVKDSLTISGNSYVVQESDNLWEICVRAYGDGYKWQEVAEANQLVNSDLLEIGQKLKLPRN